MKRAASLVCLSLSLLLPALVVVPSGASYGVVPAERVSVQAKPKKPRKPKIHTYQVTYVLAGHLDVSTIYANEDDGFCTGDGFTESADWRTSANWSVRMTVGKAGQIKSVAGIQGDTTGRWSATGLQTAEGDSCGTSTGASCDGSMTETRVGQTTLFTQATRRTAYFQVGLSGLPTERDVPADCRQTEAYYPVLDLGLFRALRPWNSLRLALPWARLRKLKKGQSITRNVRYTTAPEGYALTSCNHSPPCDATIPTFTHDVRVKRIR